MGKQRENNRPRADFDPSKWVDILDRYDAERWGREVPERLLRALAAAPLVDESTLETPWAYLADAA